MFDFSYSNILHSNIINFVVMVAFFALLVYLLKAGNRLEEAEKQVKNKLDDSDNKKAESNKFLKESELKLKDVEDEVAEIITSADKIAQDFLSRAEDEAQKVKENIEANAEKVFENEIKKIKNELKRSMTSACTENAKENIMKMLKNDPSLHQKVIDDAIESLDKVKF